MFLFILFFIPAFIMGFAGFLVLRTIWRHARSFVGIMFLAFAALFLLGGAFIPALISGGLGWIILRSHRNEQYLNEDNYVQQGNYPPPPPPPPMAMDTDQQLPVYQSAEAPQAYRPNGNRISRW